MISMKKGNQTISVVEGGEKHKRLEAAGYERTMKFQTAEAAPKNEPKADDTEAKAADTEQADTNDGPEQQKVAQRATPKVQQAKK